MDKLFAALTPTQHKTLDAWWATQASGSPEGTQQGSFDFLDNERVARKGCPDEEAAYEAARDRGCCGFVDVELPSPDGTTLLYGFNYGH